MPKLIKYYLNIERQDSLTKSNTARGWIFIDLHGREKAWPDLKIHIICLHTLGILSLNLVALALIVPDM